MRIVQYNVTAINDVISFIRKYPGCLKVNTFLLLALGFYLNPKRHFTLSTNIKQTR